MTHACFRVGSRSTPVSRRGPGARLGKVGTLTRAKLRYGKHTVAFTGRIGKRALKPGAYRATLRAQNAKGRSRPLTVGFSIAK